MKFGSVTEHIYIRNIWSYPGSKFNAIDIIYPYIKNEPKIMSPFLGGGSLELNLAYRGHEVVGYDYFDDLANLWTQLCDNNITLYYKVHAYREDIIDKLDFQSYKIWYHEFWSKFFKEDDPDYQYWQNVSKIDRAAGFFVLLQTAFSMVISAGWPTDCYRSRCSEGNLLKIANFHKYKKSFKFGGHKSFVDSIPETSEDWFIYADPPYLLPKNNTLYGLDRGKSKELHNSFPHQLFAETIMKRGRWLISYNDSPEVRALFPGCVFKEVEWAYTMNVGNEKNKGKSSELLIFPPGTKV